MRSLTVIARNPLDGLFYKGYVAFPVKTLEPKFVEFDSIPSQDVEYQNIICIGGAIPWPKLQPGDTVLVRAINRPSGIVNYVPGTVLHIPNKCHGRRFFTVLIYASNQVFAVSRQRKDLIMIGREQHKEILDYIYLIRCKSGRKKPASEQGRRLYLQRENKCKTEIFVNVPPLKKKTERSSTLPEIKKEEVTEEEGKKSKELKKAKSDPDHSVTVYEKVFPLKSGNENSLQLVRHQGTHKHHNLCTLNFNFYPVNAMSQAYNHKTVPSITKDVPTKTAPSIIQDATTQTVPSNTSTAIPQANHPKTTIPQVIISQTITSEGTTSQTVTPQTAIPQTAIPQVTVTPLTTIPQANISQTITPQGTITQTISPKTGTPQTTIPEDVTPQTTISEDVTPQTTIPQADIPQTINPNGTMTQTINPNTVTRQTIIPADVTPQTASPQTIIPQTIIHQTAILQTTNSKQKNSPDKRSISTDETVVEHFEDLKFKKDQVVLARWKDDGWYYYGKYKADTPDGRYRVMDRTGYSEEMQADDIIVDEKYIFQPRDTVVALHKEHIFSYAPGKIGEIHKSDNSEFARVEFYDGTIRDVPIKDQNCEMFKIDAQKYQQVVKYIRECEDRVVRNGSAIAWREDTGFFSECTVKRSTRRSYIVSFNGELKEIPSMYLFHNDRETNRDIKDWKCALVPIDVKGTQTYVPAKVESHGPIKVKLCTQEEPLNLHNFDDCFYINETFYENSVAYINWKARQGRKKADRQKIK